MHALLLVARFGSLPLPLSVGRLVRRGRGKRIGFGRKDGPKAAEMQFWALVDLAFYREKNFMDIQFFCGLRIGMDGI